MKPAAPKLASQAVDHYGRLMFGSEWAAAMARLTGTNERTVRRIRAAAAEGKEYPAARGVLAALYDAVHVLHADLQRYSRPDLS